MNFSIATGAANQPAETQIEALDRLATVSASVRDGEPGQRRAMRDRAVTGGQDGGRRR